MTYSVFLTYSIPEYISFQYIFLLQKHSQLFGDCSKAERKIRTYVYLNAVLWLKKRKFGFDYRHKQMQISDFSICLAFRQLAV